MAIAGQQSTFKLEWFSSWTDTHGVMIHGWYGSTPEEYKEYLNEVLSIGPDLIIDDSGDMVETQHK